MIMSPIPPPYFHNFLIKPYLKLEQAAQTNHTTSLAKVNLVVLPVSSRKFQRETMSNVEFDTCTKSATVWPKSSTQLFRDMLQFLACNFVEKDSYCSAIISPNTLPSCARTTWKKTRECCLLCAFLPQSPNLNPITLSWSITSINPAGELGKYNREILNFMNKFSEITLLI